MESSPLSLNNHRRFILLFLLAITFTVFSNSVTATRPCRGFLISTSYSVSVNSQNPHTTFLPLNLHRPSSSSPSSSSTLTLFTTQLTNNNNNKIEVFINRRLRLDRDNSINPVGFFLSTKDLTSLRDRTKDILSVVVALLFGVGCGALAASTVYFVWTLFTHRYDLLHEYDFDSESESDEAETPKKKDKSILKKSLASTPFPVKLCFDLSTSLCRIKITIKSTLSSFKVLRLQEKLRMRPKSSCGTPYTNFHGHATTSVLDSH
ncbi:hypothetical protein ACFE04_005888 [Oxalis oulophora]